MRVDIRGKDRRMMLLYAEKEELHKVIQKLTRRERGELHTLTKKVKDKLVKEHKTFDRVIA